MNPISSHYMAQLHLEELRRQADQQRLANQFRPAVNTLTRLRIATGRRLISLGENLIPGASIRTVGYQR